MLLFRNVLAGVDKSSCAAVLTRGVTEPLVRTERVGCELLLEERLGASRGVTGVFTVRFDASVGLSGRPFEVVFVRSVCMIPGQAKGG